MTSRLDRLFVLLEAGTGAATRRAAARQLGEIQKAHPEELQRLLGRLTKHLRSPAWETRVAAAQAVEAILANVPEWHPSPLAVAKDEKVEEATGRLSCESLDIESMLRHGAHLMGSEGRQYVLEELPPGANDTKERLARQRRQLNAQLGLDVAASLGLDLGAVYSNEDLCPATPEPEPSTSKGLAGKFEVPRRPVLELVPLSKGLSSREMNLAKRKARHQLTKQKSQERPPSPQPEPERKKVKVETDELDLESSPAPESSGSWAPSARWPLEAWCGALQSQLFDAAWEARHGAASALRELLRARVSSTAGHQAHMTEEQMEQAHQEWLEDMALRLLCVLALDRFGDFVSDQVVAPVRESCAQTLGVALAVLSESRVGQVARLLSRLGAQPQWECRHGALLGFKYLLAARPEVAVSHGALEHLMAGVGDAAEDVAAVAAGALVPAAAALATARPRALPLLVTRLLQLLRDQDELAAPANSYLALLAALMALPQAAKLLHPVDLSDVLPRLWPYLDHSTSSVRKATLQTLRTLTRPLVTDCTNTNGDVTAKHEGQTGEKTGGNGKVQAENGGKNGGNVGKISESGEKNCDNSNLESNIKSNGLEINTKSNGQIHADNKINCNEIKSSDAQANFSDVKQSNNGDTEVKSNSVSEEDDDNKLNWTPELLQEAMRHVYQRILFEHVHEIQEIALQVWRNLVTHSRLPTLLMAACPGLAGWLCLAMQPARLPLEPHLILRAQPHTKERRTRTNSQSESDPPEARPSQKWFVGGSETQPAAARDRNVMRARCLAARALGLLSCYLVQPAPGIEYATDQESPIDYYVKVMVVYLKAGSALQRLVAALVVAEWARHTADTGLFPPSTGGQNGTVARDIGRLAPPLLVSTLHCALNQSLYYDEVALNCNRVLQEARDLVAMMKHYKLPVPEQFNNIIRLEQVFEMTLVTEPMVGAVKVKRVSSSLEERRRSLHAAAAQCTQEQNALHVAVQAALAGACANLHAVPEKLNPVVRPLMESIKREASEELQALAASTLSELLGQLVGREPCPNNKVLANLKAFLRCDPEYTPRICPETTPEADSGSDSGESNAGRNTSHMPHLDKYSGILTLWEQQRQAERSAPRRGRPPAQASLASAAIDQVLLNEDEGRKLLRIQRRGATLALTRLTAHYGDRLPEALPKLWEFIIQPLEKVPTDQELEQTEAEPAEELISRLQVLEVVCSHIGPALWPRVVAGVGALASLTRAALTAVRHMAARCLAAMATRDPLAVMHTVIDELVPLLSCGAACSPTERARCGAAEALSRVVDALQLGIVPYIVLLVIPLLGRMSDQCCAVRVMSTRCFASLIQLMPLDGAVPEPAGLAPELKARRVKDRRFLEQLFNPKSIKDYKVPVPVNAELRSYQQAGVNWLRFLNEYKLHGVLCDDMGLGKTLQSIVVLSGSHWERRQEGLPERPSLVVCPPTLTGHWVFEVNKFIPSQFLRPLQYVGPPLERERLRQTVHHYNLIVASYDIVRKDIEFFSAIRWHYCVLDEGHVIKNGRTKAFQAIRQLVANHRLILSGTPIQNNVLELWSLFDFLMPGLLGTEREFTARYSRPILAARDPKATPHQLQSGALACEALHRQVLPFLLRRVKEDVLKELPPKITQDYYCELSPLQRRLYEHFARHHLPDTEHQASHTHVFQALHYLQSVCNHPKLVLTPEHPEAAAVAQQLQRQGSTLDHIDHSAKLPALKQLLLDCGIGVPSDCESEVVVSQHRALIFCQLKKMLDIVEKDLLQRHLPTVTYLRLDGSVPAHQRHAIVTRFNNDVSIDVLLLTTQVGGLGLNLTGADTVIFVEHDWNPMKDLQAMDRAHRIGQRRVVNVYRLITRDTLEEKIMGLQKFKLQTANTVISSENASLQTMGTDQLLDLFQISKPQQLGNTQPLASGSTAPPLESLPDLWDDKQYEEEYDMSSFIRSLHTMNNS